MEKQREYWVDDVKILACVLVVLGHFFQSMVKSGIISDSLIFEWFNATLYYFHVPLFFICSGYLFQKYSSVRSFNEWKASVGKKLVALGVPYFVFSLLTWFLKVVFSSTVNDQVDGLAVVLFFKPLSPYWYLYTLFFIFFISFTVANKRELYLIMSIAMLIKVLNILGIYTGVYAIDKIFEHAVWFVFGVGIAYGIFPKLSKRVLLFFATVFILLSPIPVLIGKKINWFSFVMGIIACYVVICFFIQYSQTGKQDKKLLGLSRYTMPIFLMHTLFAAPFRTLLLKLNITEWWIHVLLGLLISFIGPIIAMMLLDKLKPLDFIVYPLRYVGKKA